jgi:DNA-binding NarL/FixJ family response regulator
MANLPRLVLADDHVLLLEAFERLLEHDYTIVATVADGDALVEQALALNPEAIVTDVTMPLCSGLDAARRILAVQPWTRIVFLTVHEDASIAAEAFRIGGAGYLLKRSAAAELKRALATALEGGRYLTPLVADGDAAKLLEGEGKADPIDRLSAREREVLVLLGQGLPMKEVGRRLGITARTVAFHKYRIMATLGAKTNADLVQIAMRHTVAR